jgi:hypothetical protein
VLIGHGLGKSIVLGNLPSTHHGLIDMRRRSGTLEKLRAINVPSGCCSAEDESQKARSGYMFARFDETC